MSHLPPFDPEWLAVEEASGGRSTLKPMPIDEARATFDAAFAGITKDIRPDEDIQTHDETMPNGQRMRIYIPKGVKEIMPVGLYIHSGGWYTGSVEIEDHLIRIIAKRSKIALFCPDYRFAPEHPYPAGLNDCCDAYEWILEHAAQHNGDSSKRFIMGGSAGGNLTTAVALKYTSHAKLKPSGLIIASPFTCDLRAYPEDYKKRYTPEEYTDSPILTREVMSWATEQYGAQPTDPLGCSVLLHPDIKLLPQTYMAATTKDPTHQETVWLYEEMRKQGVKADLVEWKGWPHFFWIVPGLKGSERFMEVWNEKLGGMIGAIA